MSACEKGGQWEKALALLHKMREAGMTADAMSFIVAVSPRKKGEQWEQAVALRYFTDARGRHDRQCDQLHCGYLSVRKGRRLCEQEVALL